MSSDVQYEDRPTGEAYGDGDLEQRSAFVPRPLRMTIDEARDELRRARTGAYGDEA